MSSPSGVLSAYAYKGMQNRNGWAISDNQWFTVPKDGYILAQGTADWSKYWSDTYKPTESLFVNLLPTNGGGRHAFLMNYSKDIGSQSFSSYIPVSKGDMIAVGVQFTPDYQKEILPPWCSVAYYPIKLKDASSI